MKKLLQEIFDWLIRGNHKWMKYQGCIDYPGRGIIYDATVYDLVVDHSRLIDRLIPARMAEMSLLAQNILMGLYSNVNPEDPSWRFYGKHSLENRDWG